MSRGAQNFTRAPNGPTIISIRQNDRYTFRYLRVCNSETHVVSDYAPRKGGSFRLIE